MSNTRTLVFAALLTLTISACNQTPENLTRPDLETQYGTPQQDSASFVVTNESGYLYTLGGVWDYYGDSDEVVLKRFSPAGQELWSYSVDSCGDLCYTDEGGAGIDAAGNAYVLTTFGGSDIDQVRTLRKVSPAGTLLWSHEVSSSGGGMATSAKGETFVTSSYNPRLTKYGSDGQQVFEVPLAAPAFTLAVASDGTLYAFGGDKLVKYSSMGKVLWQRVVPYLPQNPWDIAVRGTSVYLSSSSVGNVFRIRLYKYTSGGTLVWQRSITPFGSAYTTDISSDALGNVYLSGETNPDETDFDLFVRKYTPSGSVAWTYAPDLRGTSEGAFGVSAADSGRVYVVGSTNGKVNGNNHGGQDAFLLRLDTAGKKVWSR